ncbi:Uncharacterised protein [Yersinia aldovae]|uniref:hypothetical protein n=1 Tax=Yersinia aldovae TaxID=29483 RepID=UPI0005E00B1F|nr:hypothetical protein [Yersinia aldovae]CNJ03925.1 Uncharacterised protein [Yersinia aldovae]
MNIQAKPSLRIDNSALQAAIIRASKAIAVLGMQGTLVERIDVEQGGNPTLVIRPDIVCRADVVKGKASRYITGSDEVGKFEVYKYLDKIEGCRVEWKERKI